MLPVLFSNLMAQTPVLNRGVKRMSKDDVYTIKCDKAIVVIHNIKNWIATVEIPDCNTSEISAGELHIVDFGSNSGKLVITATGDLLLQYTIIIPDDNTFGKEFKILTKITDEDININGNVIIASPHLVRVTKQIGSLNACIVGDDGKMINQVDKIVNNFYIAFISTKNAVVKCRPIIDDPFSIKSVVSYIRGVPTFTGEPDKIVDRNIVVDFGDISVVDFYIQTYDFSDVTIKAGKDHYKYFQNLEGIYLEEPNSHIMHRGDLKVNFIKKNFITFVSLLDNQAKYVNVIIGNYESAINSGIFWFPTTSSHEIEVDVFGATIRTATRTITTGNGELSLKDTGSFVLDIPAPAVMKHTSNDPKLTSFASGKSVCDDSYGLLLREAPIAVKDVCGFSLMKNSAYIFETKGNFTLGVSAFASVTVIVNGVESSPLLTMVQLNGVSSIIVKVFENECSVAFAPSSWECQDFITLSGKHVEMDLKGSDDALSSILGAKNVCLFALTDSDGNNIINSYRGKIKKYSVGCGFVFHILSLDSNFMVSVILGSKNADYSGSSATSLRVYSYNKQQLTDIVLTNRPPTRYYRAPIQTQIIDSIAPGDFVSIDVIARTTIVIQKADDLILKIKSGKTSQIVNNGSRVIRFHFGAELQVWNNASNAKLLHIDALKNDGDTFVTSELEDSITVGGSDNLPNAWIVPPGDSQMVIMNPDPQKEITVNGVKFHNFLQKTFAVGSHRSVSAKYGAVVSWKTPLILDETEPVNTTVLDCKDHICFDNVIQKDLLMPKGNNPLLIIIIVSVVVLLIVTIVAIVLIVKCRNKRKLKDGISADIKVALV